MRLVPHGGGAPVAGAIISALISVALTAFDEMHYELTPGLTAIDTLPGVLMFLVLSVAALPYALPRADTPRFGRAITRRIAAATVVSVVLCVFAAGILLYTGLSGSTHTIDTATPLLALASYPSVAFLVVVCGCRAQWWSAS